MGQGDFCVNVRELAVSDLMALFGQLESQSAERSEVAAQREATNAQLVESQFQELTAVLFPAARTEGYNDHGDPRQRRAEPERAAL
jgi:hypothetical protein